MHPTNAYAVPDGVQSVSLTHTQVVDAMRQNLDAMAATAAPDVYLAAMSPIHHSIWSLITEVIDRKERYTKHAIGIPRGHAKTHMLKLLILRCILFTDLRFILVVGNTLKLARNIIDDVMSMLGSDNIRAIYGDYRLGIEKDNAEIKEFNFQGRDITLVPVGAGSSVRGANVNNRRPQLIICDDMQSREQAQSPEQSKELQAWFTGTLLKARDYSRCHVIYVGNMYPDLEITPPGHPHPIYTCILRNLQNDHGWISWVTGAFLADGSCIWPAVHPIEALLEDLESDRRMGQAHIWYAEVQNDPRATAGMFFDANLATPFTTPMEFPPVGKYLMIDPSLGKKTSDNQVVGLFHLYDEQGPVWQEVRVLPLKAPQLVMEVISWVLAERIPAIFCEAYAYQESLLHWFEFWLEQMGVPEDAVKLIPISRAGGNNSKSKNAWISESFGAVYNGVLRMRPEVFAAYLGEAVVFNPLLTTNSDGILDVGEYGVRIFHEHKDQTYGNFYLAESYGGYSSGEHTEFDVRTYDFRNQ